MDKEAVLAQLEAWADPESAAGMARYGIRGLRAYGVRIPRLRRLARELGRDQRLALELWSVPTRETRILACMVAEPERTGAELAESWARAFTDWEVCDQCCMNLFEKTPWAWEKALEWSRDEAEFVKRAGFVLMARLAVSAKEAPDERFHPFLERLAAAAGDPRPMVRKAQSWALRQIGKRGSRDLSRRALALAEKLAESPDRHARWVGRDALRDLRPRA